MPNSSARKGPKRKRRRRSRRNQKKRAKATNAKLGAGTQPRGLTARSVGRKAGGAIGKLFGAEGIGSALGDIGGSIFKSLTGIGDYSDAEEMSGIPIDSNTVVQPLTASQVPEINSDGVDGTRVRHREYVRDLVAGTDVLPNDFTLRINPTNNLLFPWLTGIARQFEQYQILGMVFEFVSTAGTAVATNQANMGDVNIATQYNANAPAFGVDKSRLLNHFFSTSGATYEDQMHPIECNPDETPALPRYVSIDFDIFTTQQDERLNDWGITNFLLTAAQSNYNVGQLWVTYDIVFFKQRVPRPLDPYFSAGQLARLAEHCVRSPHDELSQLVTKDAMQFLAEFPKPPEEVEHKTQMDQLCKILHDFHSGSLSSSGSPPTPPNSTTGELSFDRVALTRTPSIRIRGS